MGLYFQSWLTFGRVSAPDEYTLRHGNTDWLVVDAAQIAGSPLLVLGTLSPDNASHFVHVGKKRRKLLQMQSPHEEISNPDKVIGDVIEHIDKGAISYTTWPALVADIRLVRSHAKPPFMLTDPCP